MVKHQVGDSKGFRFGLVLAQGRPSASERVRIFVMVFPGSGLIAVD
jgi:hypothetical protein